MGVFVLLGLWVNQSNQKTHRTNWLKRIASLDLSNVKHFFGVYLISLLLIFWFSSTSLASYNPIILADRMWMPLIPPLTILVSWVIANSPNSMPKLRTSLKLVISIVFIGWAGAFIFYYEKLPNLWLPLILLIALLITSFQKKWWKPPPLFATDIVYNLSITNH